jgi:hypothetical protein
LWRCADQYEYGAPAQAAAGKTATTTVLETTMNRPNATTPTPAETTQN